MNAVSRLAATVCGVTLVATSFPARAEPVPMWVSGSMVNVRARPDPNAEVLTRLTTNAAVSMLGQQGKFCEVSWNAGEHGFVACSLLESKPQSIEDLDGYPLRAFWVEPSFARLLQAGHAIRDMMLTEKQISTETPPLTSEDMLDTEKFDTKKPPALKRFPVPEFDAMKDLMKKGVVAPKSLWVQPPSWEAVSSAVAGADADSGGGINELMELRGERWWLGNERIDVDLYQQIKLPAALPSYFRGLEGVGRPSATAQELSAQFKVPHRIRVMSKPHWVIPNYGNPYVYGAWDIGGVEIQLSNPLYEISIDKTGKTSASTTNAPELHEENNDTDSEGQSRPFVVDWSKAVAVFRSREPLHFGKVKVTTSKQTLKAAASKDEDYRASHFTSAVMRTIDLDGDGKPDLIALDALRKADCGEAPNGGDFVALKITFINANGRWFVLDMDTRSDCAD